MIVYEILPLVGVGPLRFGMTRPEARRAMKPEPDTFYRQKDDPYPADGYHLTALQVLFDPVDRVECVELSPSPAFEARFRGQDARAVEAHVASCVRCTALVRDLEGIRVNAGMLPELSPSRDLWQGISERIDAPVFIDERLPKPPARPGRLNFCERYARLSHYLRPILAAARPASIGVFGGRLEYGRLEWWAVLFVMLIIHAPAGDRRNWEAIRVWAAGLPEAMGLEELAVIR